MHVHLPKPLHGWREFAGEVGIIVLGVLIALAFEQGVEAWHSMQERDHIVRALSSEAVAMAENATERVGLNKCNGDRLAELAAKLNQPNQRWHADVMPPSPYALKTVLPLVYRVPRRSTGTD